MRLGHNFRSAASKHWSWILLVLSILPVLWLVNGVLNVREEAARSECAMRFNQLALALHNYHDTKGHFPPAFIAGPDGKPWHSWRVLILPYIEEHKVYDRYRFDEPWYGPNNRRLADKIHLQMFQCCSAKDYGKGLHTNIVAIVGAGTAFPGVEPTRLADFRDSGRHTILLAEYAGADIPWMEPRDLDAGAMSFLTNDRAAPSISSPHPVGPAVVFADGISVFRIRPSVSADTLSALVRMKNKKWIRRDDLARHDRWNGATLSE